MESNPHHRDHSRSSQKRKREKKFMTNDLHMILEQARFFWLDIGPTETYLLMENTVTGDVFFVLEHLKPIGNNGIRNRARTISKYNYRHVNIPVNDHPFKELDNAGLLFWKWTFSCPMRWRDRLDDIISAKERELKITIHAPRHGGIHFILMPVLYNALTRELLDPADNPFFVTVYKHMQESTYQPLLSEINAQTTAKLKAKVATQEFSSHPTPLFVGPPYLEPTALYYMLAFADKDQLRSAKYHRATVPEHDEDKLKNLLLDSERDWVAQPTELLKIFMQKKRNDNDNDDGGNWD